MARRTIRARRASPYLLYLVIAFSILMVVCAVGWAWTYSLRNEALVLTFGQQAAERGTDLLFKEVQDKYPEDRNLAIVGILEKRDQVATEYRSEIQRLTDQLVAKRFDTEHGDVLRTSVSNIIQEGADIRAQAKQALQKSYAVGKETPGEVQVLSMKDAIQSLSQRLDALVVLAGQDTTTMGQLETQIKGLQDELTAAKAAYNQQVAQLQAQLTDEKNRLIAARDSALATGKQFEEGKQQAMDRLIAERRQWSTDKERLERQLLVDQNNLKEQAETIKKFRTVPAETGVDGRIVSVAQGGNVAYSDLGKKDGVLLGMTFSIFGATDLGKTNAQPKAQCRIVKIMQDASELRIYQLQGDNPVVAGDVLLNPVYDRERRLRFVLVGKMDINADGIDDTEQLKALIQEFGGRVDSTLTVQTDYLVVGEEPQVPAAPGAGASPMERQIYEAARKAFIDYTEARARAESFGIPILSLNRFLGLVGIAGQG
jgi:hypothetical protein